MLRGDSSHLGKITNPNFKEMSYKGRGRAGRELLCARRRSPRVSQWAGQPGCHVQRGQVSGGAVAMTAGEWLHHQLPAAIHHAAPAGDESHSQQGAEPSNISLNKVTPGRFVPVINLVNNRSTSLYNFSPTPPPHNINKYYESTCRTMRSFPRSSFLRWHSASFFKNPYKSWKITFTTGYILRPVR